MGASGSSQPSDMRYGYKKPGGSTHEAGCFYLPVLLILMFVVFVKAAYLPTSAEV
jgi:hypothetical protein